ncbi:MAG: HAD family hydrolase [Actinomycetota bacterium]
MTVRTVFFDAGETLLHAHPTFPDLLASTLRDAGHDVDPDAVHDRIHLMAEAFSAAAAAGDLWTTSAASSRRFWGDVYAVLLDELGVAADRDLVERLYATFTDHANYVLFEDVLPTLEALRDGGIRLGLISNFEDWLVGLLEALGLTAFFETRVISGLEGLEKPDPAIFHLALDRLGVEAAASAYVGDSPEFDMAPASALGMLPVLIDRRDRHPEVPATRIRALTELPPLLGLSSS